MCCYPGASIDTALTQALSDKSELESKLKGLEQMIISGGGSMPANLGSFSGTLGSSSISMSVGVSSDEVMKLNEKIADQQLTIAELHRSVEEYEEYEQHSRALMDEETAKLEMEKQSLQNERYKLLKDRSYVEEKEMRIMSLFTNIEEKESKLKHMKSNMKEQLEQWQRSITDLQVTTIILASSLSVYIYMYIYPDRVMNCVTKSYHSSWSHT